MTIALPLRLALLGKDDDGYNGCVMLRFLPRNECLDQSGFKRTSLESYKEAWEQIASAAA